MSNDKNALTFEQQLEEKSFNQLQTELKPMIDQYNELHIKLSVYYRVLDRKKKQQQANKSDNYINITFGKTTNGYITSEAHF